jgi:hypothetical protein
MHNLSGRPDAGQSEAIVRAQFPQGLHRAMAVEEQELSAVQESDKEDNSLDGA